MIPQNPQDKAPSAKMELAKKKTGKDFSPPAPRSGPTQPLLKRHSAKRKFHVNLLLLLTFLTNPLAAQEPAPRISLEHSLNSLSIKLPWARQTNSWCIEASSDLRQWKSLGEIFEINGSGDFPVSGAPLHKERYYRAIDKGRDIQAALTRNRARWDDSGHKNYDFTFQWLCYCIPDFVTPVTISVRDNKIDSIIRLEDGTALDPSQLEYFRTIDGLFDFLQEALDQKPHSISARFDARFGTPGKAWVDYNAGIADEERGFVVEDLRIAGANPVQITNTPPAELKLDPFSLGNATISGNTLTINLSHGGGCAEHEYELFMSPGTFLESFPVQANLYLRHNANGDICRALITKDITFDLTPIAELHGQPGPILLNIHDYPAEDPPERIQVKFDQ